MQLASKGKPCDPPIVDGVVFEHLEDDIWISGEVEEQVGLNLLRIPAFTVYGGAKGVGVTPVDPAIGADEPAPETGNPVRKKK